MAGLFDFLTAGVGSVVNAVGNGIASYNNLKSVRETNEANFRLAQWQNEQNVKMWNMNNEYNSPSSQMQRLSQAGLNPNLVYGNGSVGNSSSAPTAASAPTMQAYQMPQNVLGDLSSMMDNFLKLAQVKKTEQETDNLAETQRLTRFQAQKEELNVIYQNYLNSKTRDEAYIWQKRLAQELRLMELSGDRTYADTQLSFAKVDDTYSSRFYRDNVLTPLTQAQTAKSNEDRLSVIAERSLIDMRRNLMASTIQQALATAAATYKGMELTDKQMSKISAEIIDLSARYTGHQLENEVTRLLVQNGINLRAGGPTSFWDKIKWTIDGVFKLR